MSASIDPEADLEQALVTAAASRFGLTLSLAKASRLIAWLESVRTLSREINLIAELPLAEATERHLLDSLALAHHFGPSAWPEHLQVLDFGTGGGFPGVVLGLLQDTWRMTLSDARNKKLLAVASLLGPEERRRFRLLHGRLESLLREDRGLHLSYDLITVRAVGSLADIVQVVAPALAPGGTIVAWKSQRLEAKERELGQEAAVKAGLQVLHELPYEAAFPGLLVRYQRPPRA